MRTNDRNIRVLAVYTMLLNAEKTISVKAIKNRIEKDYNIKTSIKTIYYDIETIRLFADLEHIHGKGYRIKKTAVKPGDTVYCIYYSDDNKRYQIDELEALEVSNRRIWLDGFYEKISEFGKSLFLTREEAEKALAERKELDNE